MSALSKLALLAALLAPVQASAMTYTYSVYNEHLAIVAEGMIEAGDGEQFDLFLKTLPRDLMSKKGNFVFFNSAGGIVEAALKIARAIERNHFMTGIVGPCQSACVLVWAVGERKYAVTGDCIGVHSAMMDVAGTKNIPKALAKKTRDNIENTVNITMATWLWDHGAPSIAMKKIFETPASDIYCLTAADLKAWDVTVMEHRDD